MKKIFIILFISICCLCMLFCGACGKPENKLSPDTDQNKKTEEEQESDIDNGTEQEQKVDIDNDGANSGGKWTEDYPLTPLE